jgi:hypothetical protein
MPEMWSGITTAKTPPKKSQAGSNPSMMLSMACEKGQPDEAVVATQGVKISAWQTRRRSVGGS